MNLMEVKWPLTAREAGAEPVLDQGCAGVDSIKFSINAVEREAYKLIHGRDELEAVLKNLEWLYGYKEKHQIPINIYVSSVATRYNSNENAIREKLEPLCDELAIYHVMNHEGLMPEVDLFLSDSAVECDVDARKKAPCPMVFNRLHVYKRAHLHCKVKPGALLRSPHRVCEIEPGKHLLLFSLNFLFERVDTFLQSYQGLSSSRWAKCLWHLRPT